MAQQSRNRRFYHRLITNFVVVAAVLQPASGGVFTENVFSYGGSFNLRIPANPPDTKGWMEDAVITVSEHHTIADVDVCISLIHTSDFDLQISLQNPAGRRVYLNYYDVGDFFTGADYAQTIFDDQAETPIEQASPPFTGRFRPKAGNFLNIFNSEDVYGLWRLKIYDAFAGDSGFLTYAAISIVTPEPSTIVLLIAGIAILMILMPHRRHLRRK